ncbi:MAG: protein phosphatase 2C domain-containing protein [Verrucomicrobiota bacterium]
MKIAKDGIRSIVRIGYDGRVYKTFRGTGADERFDNEVKVLHALEERGCEYVPRLLESDRDSVTIVTTNCGAPAENSISEKKSTSLFDELKETYGIEHDDPFPRNITYDSRLGRFCIIDFELATILPVPSSLKVSAPVDKLSWAGMTRDGRRKPGNQDSLSVFGSMDGWGKVEELVGDRDVNEEGLIFAVSDGMGGPKGGEVASNLAVSELHRFLPAMMGDFSGNADSAGVIEQSIHSLHTHVLRAAANREGLEDMGATVVCGLFYRGEMHFGHVGDSRLYQYRAGELMQLTDDHTYVGRLQQQGKLSELEARMHPRKNILSQCIGGQCQYITPQVGATSVEPGDWFLICSDGIIDGLWDKNIRQAFEDADEKGQDAPAVADRLMEWAYSEAGMDDTTLFVIHVH